MRADGAGTGGKRWTLAVQCALAVLFGIAVASCGRSDQGHVPLTAPVQSGPLRLVVHGQGKLKAVHVTSLMVPGSNFSSRRVTWLRANGSRVRKGEVVARFSVKEPRQKLAETHIDLSRNTLAKQGKHADLAAQKEQLSVDMTDVGTQLKIAHRYATAGNEAIARDRILDAVQDQAFLQTKRSILLWRRSQASARAQGELAVLGAKRATLELSAKQQEAELNAQVVRAPHAGVLLLEPNWSGQTPQVGSTLWAGQPLASLPNLDHLQLKLAVPQLQAQGVKVGDAVRMHPLGAPQQAVTSHLTWVAGAAQPISQDSPVKYMLMKASVPEKALKRYGWSPGQPFVAEVILLDARHALSVPNLGIDSNGGHATVTVLQHGKEVSRNIELGVRGATRSQVLKGLHAGEQVVLNDGGRDGHS